MQCLWPTSSMSVKQNALLSADAVPMACFLHVSKQNVLMSADAVPMACFIHVS